MKNILIPKNKHALIRFSKTILKIEEPITQTHVEILKSVIQQHLDSGMSPADIKKHYKIEYSDFGMFIKKCLGMKIMSCKEAVNNYNKKAGIALTDDKKIYQRDCGFKFDPYSIPEIPGYEKLLELGMYHPIRNPNGVCRDHIVSVEYGWRNGIPPEIISHPGNCQFLTNIENIVKNDRSDMTVQQLQERINTGIVNTKDAVSIRLRMTKEHKQKISETNKKYMNITNDVVNLRILKDSPIPEGFRRGMKSRPNYKRA